MRLLPCLGPALLVAAVVSVACNSADGISDGVDQVVLDGSGQPAVKNLKPQSLESWMHKQKHFALKSVTRNIGPNKGSHGALPGIVIASPSNKSPNYLYSWTRDAALVMKALLETYISTGSSSIRTILENYVTSSSILQHLPNPSGSFESGGLGEPKFNIDETAFTESWGRPQRDGPALRATTLIGFANVLMSAGIEDKPRTQTDMTYVRDVLAPLIKADLDYLVLFWNYTGFDLWEEVSGSSFFATAVQHRALVEGYGFFSELGQPNPTYNETAINVLCFLQVYWSDTAGFVISNINLNEDKSRSGIDAASVLASIHTFDPATLTCDPTTFQPCSDRALANLKAFVDSFREIYPLNVGLQPTAPVACGRYPEDSYYSGNPWYLTTLAVAEQLYYALHTWQKAGALNVTSTSLFFFRDLYPPAAVGMYNRATKDYHLILNAVWAYADGFVAVVRNYTPPNGMLWEQYERTLGTPLSAANLTWSYGAFLTAYAARMGHMPPSWDSSMSSTICGPGGPSNLTVLVTFHSISTTYYGESIWISGSTEELGEWDTSKATVLSAAEYTEIHNVWVTEILFPASTTLEYKFIRKGKGGTVTWETGANRVLVTNAAGEHQFISATWQA